MTAREITLRVLIVAAYASTRAGLHVLLNEGGGIEIVAEVSGSAGLERLLTEAAPDVVVCDNTEGDGAHVLAALADRGVGLVLLDDDPHLVPVLAASSLPGYGLLCRNADASELAGAVRAAAVGLAVLDRGFVPAVVKAGPGTLDLLHKSSRRTPGCRGRR